MTNNLPPFSTNPTCPKCGGTRVRVFWQAAFTDPIGGRDLPECVVRTCKRCHYDWRELPLDATPADDDEPDDAYLAAKLASQCLSDAQKPASTARQGETGISYPIDQQRAAESNLERSPTCAQEARPGIGADEPSIPVSRIVAVLAEQLLIVERVAAQKEDPLWRDWYAITNIAEILGIHGPVMAELARQRKEA